MTICFDREGFIVFPDGSRYKGDLIKGIPDGEGKIIFSDNTIYEG